MPTINFREGVKFNSSGNILIKDNECELFINKNSTFESTSFALTENKSKITIGSDCMFSYDIELKTGDSHSILDIITGKRINFAEDILIGNHVWIGAHSVLLKGTQIAKDSIVASNSIITKSFINSNTILGGNPAKVIKENVNWDRKRLSE